MVKTQFTGDFTHFVMWKMQFMENSYRL